MKTRIYFLAFLLGAGMTGFAQNSDSLGLPGDNLDLSAVLEQFKQAKNPQDFEKRLNDKSTHLNNLDLNGDGKVDYLRVIDNSKSDAHAMVIQDPVNDKESQDVAVIELEKKGDKSAQLQIVGDKELYGDDYIVEPSNTKSGDSQTEGKFSNYRMQDFVFVNVYYWPCVEYVYYPEYVVWVSPWYWSYWPGWWSPWEPYPYYTYYGWNYPYHQYCAYTYEYRVPQAHVIYQPRRVASNTVVHRYADDHRRYEARPADQRGPQRRNVNAGNGAPAGRTQGNGKTQAAPRNGQAEPNGQPQKRGSAEPQRNPQAEPQKNPQAEPQRNPQAEPQRNPQAEPQRNPQAEPQRNPQAEPQRNPQAEPQRNPQAEPQRNPQAEPQRQPQAQPREPRQPRQPQSRPQSQPRAPRGGGRPR